MTRSIASKNMVAVSIALLCTGTGGLASAQSQSTGNATAANATRDRSDVTDAIDTVNKAVQVVHQMSADREMASLLKNAKGVYVVPEYGRGLSWSAAAAEPAFCSYGTAAPGAILPSTTWGA